MSRPRIVINVYGGVVQDVFSSDSDAQVTVVDWDAEACDSLGPGYVVVPDKFGRQSPAIVSRHDAEPLGAMNDTLIKQAIQRAEFLYGQT